MGLSVITCVSGRLELWENHLRCLFECEGFEDIEYCVGMWGKTGKHHALLARPRARQCRRAYVREVPDNRFFPLPMAYNAALEGATEDRLLVVGSEILLPKHALVWAANKTGDDAAWITDCYDGKDGREYTGPKRFGAFPYAMAISRQALLNIGGWDEAFADGTVFDDVDLALRLLASGVLFYWDHQVAAVHQWHPKVGGASRDKYARRNQAIVEERFGGPINDLWPAWWRGLRTGIPRKMPADRIAEQCKTRALLWDRGYPVRASEVA